LALVTGSGDRLRSPPYSPSLAEFRACCSVSPRTPASTRRRPPARARRSDPVRAGATSWLASRVPSHPALARPG